MKKKYFIKIPASPINTANPKHAKKAMNTITNSLLCMEYNRIWTDLKKNYYLNIYIYVYKISDLTQYNNFFFLSLKKA